VLKETKDRLYFTNSYGQTVSVKKDTLNSFAFKERSIEHVFSEVAETTDRLFRRKVGDVYKTVSPMEISLELGVDIGVISKAMEQLEEINILKRQPTKTLQVGSNVISEPTGNDCIYNILKQYRPKVGM